MARLLVTALLLVALVAGLPAALGCVFPSGGCVEDMCKLLPKTYPNPNAVYSTQAAWSQPSMEYVGSYRGVWNKLASNQTPPKPNTLTKWLALKDTYKYIVNLEKVPIETNPSFKLKEFPSSLEACCNECRITQGCVLYVFQPSVITKDFPLTNSNSGKCIFLTGGTFKDDGPFNRFTGYNYGSPPSGSRDFQARTSNTNKMAYIGGFCNPGNTTTNVVDDPHFTGAHGTHFEFNGQLDKAYCLVTDERVHVNALLRGYKSENAFHASVGKDGKAIRSWIRELGLVWAGAEGRSHSLRLVARTGKAQERGSSFLAAAEFDGVAFDFPTHPGQSFAAGETALTLLGVDKKGWYDVEHYSLKVGTQLDMNFDMRVAHPKLQSPDDAEVHFNLRFNSLATTDRVHGVLGQTYRNSPEQVMKAIKYSELNQLLGSPIQADGETGKGFLEGSVADYVASEVTKADCKVSVFGASQ